MLGPLFRGKSISPVLFSRAILEGAIDPHLATGGAPGATPHDVRVGLATSIGASELLLLLPLVRLAFRAAALGTARELAIGLVGGLVAAAAGTAGRGLSHRILLKTEMRRGRSGAASS
jgi:hypothetical protein